MVTAQLTSTGSTVSVAAEVRNVTRLVWSPAFGDSLDRRESDPVLEIAPIGTSSDPHVGRLDVPRDPAATPTSACHRNVGFDRSPTLLCPKQSGLTRRRAAGCKFASQPAKMTSRRALAVGCDEGKVADDVALERSDRLVGSRRYTMTWNCHRIWHNIA